MGHQIAGNLQALLDPAGKRGRQVVEARRGDFYLFQPLLGGGADRAVMARAGSHQPFTDVSSRRHLAAQAVHRMLMYHAPFGAQQAAALGFAHAVQRPILIANFAVLRR
ncbi:hypothetical protein D3C72_2013820 [compost metagenome]